MSTKERKRNLVTTPTESCNACHDQSGSSHSSSSASSNIHQPFLNILLVSPATHLRISPTVVSKWHFVLHSKLPAAHNQPLTFFLFHPRSNPRCFLSSFYCVPAIPLWDERENKTYVHKLAMGYSQTLIFIFLLVFSVVFLNSFDLFRSSSIFILFLFVLRLQWWWWRWLFF